MSEKEPYELLAEGLGLTREKEESIGDFIRRLQVFVMQERWSARQAEEPLIAELSADEGNLEVGALTE